MVFSIEAMTIDPYVPFFNKALDNNHIMHCKTYGQLGL